MGLLEDAKRLRDAIEGVVRETVARETRDCFRVRKAVVTTAPDGTVCGVRLAGDTTELFLPYSTALSSVSIDTVVWVGIFGDNLRNAFVWTDGIPGGGGGYSYAETPNSAGGTTIEITG